jgi:hypothetical protein
VDKHSGGISKGAEASPQPKQTNKQTIQTIIFYMYVCFHGKNNKFGQTSLKAPC